MASPMDIARTVLADVPQPAVANVLEETTLTDLRQVRHKDAYGNEIGMYVSVYYVSRSLMPYAVDPDLSNPTRPRLERPLDTIKNFEKAIDDGYKRRSTHVRQGAQRPTPPHCV